VFSLYLKTTNFHWHMIGPHFRDYHLLLDEHADQILAMTDDIAGRVRKIGGATIRSIGHISPLERIPENDAEFVDPGDTLGEVREDDKGLVVKCFTNMACAMIRRCGYGQPSRKLDRPSPAPHLIPV
jgi:starvation-inducible DNA-binding protein